MYFPYYQQNTASARVTMVVRTAPDPASLAGQIQKAIWSVDPQQPIGAVHTLEAELARSTAQPRLRAVVLAVFGTMGAVLACIGVYGVAAYASARRRREVGLRMVLGADARGVRWLLVRQSMTSVIAGASVGVLAGPILTAPFPSLLSTPGISWTWSGGAAAALAACALIATWIAAYRATRVSLVMALRQE